MNQTAAKTPIHLWIVGVLAVLWNAVGAFDYSATQFRLESYMSQFTPEQLEYFYAFPPWMDAAWAIAVWASVLGSLSLLLRKAWAVWLFGLSILGHGREHGLQLRAFQWHGSHGLRRRHVHCSDLGYRPVSVFLRPGHVET